MRKFVDDKGRTWTASVARSESGDYKGRCHLALEEASSAGKRRVELADVRWNSLRTGERTVETMSDVELRRRLRAALGRDARS